MQGIKTVIKIFGILLVLISVFLNPFVVEKLFSPDENLQNVFLVVLFEVIVFFIGLFILLKSSWIFSRRKEILFSLIFFLVLFSISETAIRIIEKDKPILFTEHPYINYYGTQNYRSLDGLNIHNSLGFRGGEIEKPKPRSVYRIVLIGGSSTYEERVSDWRKDWARQLQNELQKSYNYENIEVINAGLPGWTSFNSLVNLEFKIVDLEPDLIIIYHGVNDAIARLVPPNLHLSDNIGRVKQFEKKSCIFPICSILVQRLTGREKDFLNVDAPTAGGSIDNIYDPRLGMTTLEAYKANSPIYFERNLRSMIAIAREYDSDVLLSTWAYSDQFDPQLDFASTAHHQFGFNQNNLAVKKIGEEKKVLVYDFESEMPKDKSYWADGRHVNERGAELKGELFTNFIYRNKIIENRINELKNAEK